MWKGSTFFLLPINNKYFTKTIKPKNCWEKTRCENLFSAILRLKYKIKSVPMAIKLNGLDTSEGTISCGFPYPSRSFPKTYLIPAGFTLARFERFGLNSFQMLPS